MKEKVAKNIVKRIYDPLIKTEKSKAIAEFKDVLDKYLGHKGEVFKYDFSKLNHYHTKMNDLYNLIVFVMVKEPKSKELFEAILKSDGILLSKGIIKVIHDNFPEILKKYINRERLEELLLM